jgi:nitroreductase
VLEECLRLAQQAPTASYRQDWHFVVVTDPERRAGLADLYRRASSDYLGAAVEDPRRAPIVESARYLAEHLHEVPVHVIPAIEGRVDGAPAAAQASRWASIVPAAWSFMLAARARGLGTCWTTFHLAHEREAAELLGIPYDGFTQAALIPVAYTKGTDFKPGRRLPLETMVHWDAW